MTPQRAPIELKPGDRVRIRGFDNGGYPLDGLLAHVVHDAGGLYTIEANGLLYKVMRSQLIKLKPKKKPVVVEFICGWIEKDNWILPVDSQVFPMALRGFVGKRTKVRVTVLEDE